MKYMQTYKFDKAPDLSESIAFEYEYKKSNFFEYKKYAKEDSIPVILNDILAHRTDLEYLKKQYGCVTNNEDISTTRTGPVRVEFTDSKINTTVNVSINGEYYKSLTDRNITTAMRCKQLVDHTDLIHSSNSLHTAQAANSLKVYTVLNKLDPSDIDCELIQHCITDELLTA